MSNHSEKSLMRGVATSLGIEIEFGDEPVVVRASQIAREHLGRSIHCGRAAAAGRRNSIAAPEPKSPAPRIRSDRIKPARRTIR
jgi:hypothetical protein